MLSITLAILALYTLELAKMAAEMRVAGVFVIISGALAILALVFAARREILSFFREG